MRAFRLTALSLALSLLLSGCSGASREPDELSVVRLVAADGTAGAVTLTAFPAPLEGGSEEDPEERTGTGAVPAEACLDLAADGGSLAFLGHTEHILVGEALARGGNVEPLLECAVLGDALRPDSYLWLVEGDTAAMWGQDAGGDSAARTLSAWCTASGTRRRAMAWTAAQTLKRLLRSGAAPCPVLPAGGGEPAGYAVLTRSGVAGILEDTAAEGLELLMGEACHHTVEAGETVLEVTAVRTSVEPVWVDGAFAGVAVNCRVTARRANGNGTAEENLTAAGSVLEAWAQVRLEETLAVLSEWNVDGAELRYRAAASSWRGGDVNAAWPEDLGSLSVVCAVSTHIDF